MNIQDLEKEIIAFRDDRNWKQFHSIKDLVIGLNVEVSELSELFLWKDNKEIASVDRSKIEDEIADVFIFLTYICSDFDVDLSQAVKNKIVQNNAKYPVDKSYNSNKKYNEL